MFKYIVDQKQLLKNFGNRKKCQRYISKLRKQKHYINQSFDFTDQALKAGTTVNDTGSS